MSSRKRFCTPRTAGEGPQQNNKTRPWPPGDKAFTSGCCDTSEQACSKKRPSFLSQDIEYHKNHKIKISEHTPRNLGGQHLIPLRTSLLFALPGRPITDRNPQLVASPQAISAAHGLQRIPILGRRCATAEADVFWSDLRLMRMKQRMNAAGESNTNGHKDHSMDISQQFFLTKSAQGTHGSCDL